MIWTRHFSSKQTDGNFFNMHAMDIVVENAAVKSVLTYRV